MIVECPRCALVTHDVARVEPIPWHATGSFSVNRRGLRRAVLVCDECGEVFWSSLADAVAAGETVAATLPPVDVDDDETPQPRLPHVPVLPPPRDEPADYKRKQSGDDE